MNHKIKIGVIFGGKSGEHEVSIQSAKSVMASLDPQKYTIVPIGITKNGQWYSGNSALQALQPHSTESNALANSGQQGNHDDANMTQAEGTFTKERTDYVEEGALVPSSLASEIDVVIPVMHGTFGEDGSIQGMLELMDVPYVGAGVLASAVGLDKVMMKTLFLAAGLPQVLFTSYTRKQWQTDPNDVVHDIEEKLGYPCFVKPANLGSSVGISKAKDRAGLQAALALAAQYDRKIIVEEGLNVREIEVAVLGNDQPKASVPGEVTPSNEFYDYQAKYMSGDSTLTIPANVTAEQSDEIRQLAIRSFETLDCSGLARVDFFIEQETGRVLVNEINTMPGFTAYSMYPKLWEATGLPYAELVDTLIQLALERHEDKQSIVRDFNI